MTDLQWLRDHFLSGITTIFTATNATGMLILTNLQEKASYPKRTLVSLALSTVVFLFLAGSTVSLLDLSSVQYYALLLTAVFLASAACSLIQNGLFAYVTGFRFEQYTQGILVGQGVAGVAPCLVQLVAVLAVANEAAKATSAPEASTSAFTYFLVAAAVTALSFLAFTFLFWRHRQRLAKTSLQSNENGRSTSRRSVGFSTLLRKLKWFASSMILTFGLSMFFPVFTNNARSIRDPASSGPLFQPSAFVPLGFLVWNCGDLLGRMLPLVPALRIDRSPRLLFAASVSRLIFIPFYLLCNIKGHGAKIPSDTFYFLVQLLFGATNGHIGTLSMMAAPNWVDSWEKEAAGSFMGLCIVIGLALGSLASFLVA